MWKESTRKAHSNQKICVSTSRPLQLLHIDLFGPTRTTSLGGKSYGFVIVDDFSRYIWGTLFIFKEWSIGFVHSFLQIVQNEKGYSISSIRSDHGKEFENFGFNEFCGENGISHNFSAPRTL